jgi:hypothetical protein
MQKSHSFDSKTGDSVNRQVPLAQEEWVSVLKLSTMWDFFEIRKKAIKVLSDSNMGMMSKIVIGRKYKVTEWLLEGCNSLAKRAETISMKEAETLGWEAAIRIFQMREESLATTTSVLKVRDKVVHVVEVKTPVDRRNHDYLDEIRRVFANELES